MFSVGLLAWSLAHSQWPYLGSCGTFEGGTCQGWGMHVPLWEGLEVSYLGPISYLLDSGCKVSFQSPSPASIPHFSACCYVFPSTVDQIPLELCVQISPFSLKLPLSGDFVTTMRKNCIVTCDDKRKKGIKKVDILSYSLDSVTHKDSCTKGLIPTLQYLRRKWKLQVWA